MNTERLDAASRVALAAYLHDLGKFAERARIGEASDTDVDGVSRIEREKQLNCPHYNGRYTHIHAAYTAIGFDLLEQHLAGLGRRANGAIWPLARSECRRLHHQRRCSSP
jgi:CRISPR-associated protein Csm1